MQENALRKIIYSFLVTDKVLPIFRSSNSYNFLPMEILHVSAECYPVAKAGGLGDVVGALPKYQQDAGHQAKVVMPMYRTKFLYNNEFDVVPAYVRKNMELFGNSLTSAEQFYSRVTVGKDENDQPTFSTRNTFLEGKKPD